MNSYEARSYLLLVFKITIKLSYEKYRFIHINPHAFYASRKIATCMLQGQKFVQEGYIYELEPVLSVPVPKKRDQSLRKRDQSQKIRNQRD